MTTTTHSNGATWRLLLALLMCSPLLVAEECEMSFVDPADPMLHGDPVGPDGNVLPLVPYAPAIDVGADGKYGTGDDVVVSSFLGDVDIRAITQLRDVAHGRPHPVSGRWNPIAVAEPLGQGVPIPFYVFPSDGSKAVPGGYAVRSPHLADNAVLGVAFADLDGDGYIGITHLDGDTKDHEIEEYELEPVGRRLAMMQADLYAKGEVYVSAGGPPGAELDIVVGAIAITGDLDPAKPDSHLPTGSIVMTRLPFYPYLRTDYVTGGAPGPDSLFALELRAGMEPDPSNPKIGERFTLPTDDLDVTASGALARSGAFARMGVGHRLTSPGLIGRRDRIRPGLDADGQRILYQIRDRVAVAPDGDASVTVMDLLPLDRLGNVSTTDGPVEVAIRTSPGVLIVEPDADGDRTQETLVVEGTTGVSITLDDEGVGGSLAHLVIRADGVLSRVDVLLADFDVDGSGTVDENDIDAIKDNDADRERDERFDPSFDLNGDGRIDDVDLAIALKQHENGASPPSAPGTPSP